MQGSPEFYSKIKTEENEKPIVVHPVTKNCLIPLDNKTIFREVFDNSAIVCKYCHQIYKEPTNLGCCHTFCRKCASSLEKKVNDERKKIIECPICSRETKVKFGAEKLSLNLTMLKLVDTVRKGKATSNYRLPSVRKTEKKTEHKCSFQTEESEEKSHPKPTLTCTKCTKSVCILCLSKFQLTCRKGGKHIFAEDQSFNREASIDIHRSEKDKSEEGERIFTESLKSPNFDDYVSLDDTEKQCGAKFKSNCNTNDSTDSKLSNSIIKEIETDEELTDKMITKPVTTFSTINIFDKSSSKEDNEKNYNLTDELVALNDAKELIHNCKREGEEPEAVNQTNEDNPETNQDKHSEKLESDIEVTEKFTSRPTTTTLSTYSEDLVESILNPTASSLSRPTTFSSLTDYERSPLSIAYERELTVTFDPENDELPFPAVIVDVKRYFDRLFVVRGVPNTNRGDVLMVDPYTGSSTIVYVGSPTSIGLHWDMEPILYATDQQEGAIMEINLNDDTCIVHGIEAEDNDQKSCPTRMTVIQDGYLIIIDHGLEALLAFDWIFAVKLNLKMKPLPCALAEGSEQRTFLLLFEEERKIIKMNVNGESLSCWQTSLASPYHICPYHAANYFIIIDKLYDQVGLMRAYDGKEWVPVINDGEPVDGPTAITANYVLGEMIIGQFGKLYLYRTRFQ
ncbi:DgyrCDS3098 [Dimorphilus gyrociliatus]|uniref:DgyrCDS3098 n=1 Tax=Dimorphilus gyrociliatus TaxID=2664684 RepID=A0A7I8VDC7_9ANNE|nr:DgyrCDS3098 [Dimorphilus gyrociliatus]